MRHPEVLLQPAIVAWPTVSSSSCCSFQACCRASSAALRLWQTMFRMEQQGCMYNLHHQGDAACGQAMQHLMGLSADSLTA